MNYKQPCVYIMASQRNGTLLLVYFEQHEEMLEAITREKQIKVWQRDWNTAN